MNPIFAVVLSILDAVARVAVNPALGLSGDGVRVSRIVSFVALLAREGDEGYEKLKVFDQQIKDIEAGLISDVAAVWDDLERRHASALARIQAQASGG